MPVITEKEFQEKKKIQRGGQKKSGNPSVSVKQEKPEEKKEVLKIHIFLHPENCVEHKVNYEDELVLNGETVKRICKNGLIRTRNKALINFLTSKKYDLLDVLEDSNG